MRSYPKTFAIAAITAALLCSCSTTETVGRRAPKPTPKPESPAPAPIQVQEAPPAQPLPVEAPPPPPQTALSRVLDGPAGPRKDRKTAIRTLFAEIGDIYGVNFVVDGKIHGSAILSFNGGSLRDLIQDLCDDQELWWEERGDEIFVHSDKTVIYDVDFPNLMRTANTATTISLDSSSSTGNSVSINGQTTQQQTQQGSNGNNGAAGGQSGGGSNSVHLEQHSGDGMWESTVKEIATLEGLAAQGEGKGAAHGDQDTSFKEIVTVNPAVGRAIVTTTAQRQGVWKDYFEDLNRRLNAQVVVEIKVHSIQLNNQSQLGFNWSQVQSTISGGSSSFSFQTSNNQTTLFGNPLSPSNLLGNFSTGKLALALQAMQQQGKLTLITDGSVRLLNNQWAYLKRGDDKPVFNLSESISLNSTNTGGGIGTSATNAYSQSRQTIGFVSPIYVHISTDRHIEIVLEPARTSLNGIVTSQDGTQNAFDVNSEAMSTMIRLRDGESAIIGGLVEDLKSKDSNGVPYLSSLPYVGALARDDAINNTRTELIVTVSAHVIDP